MTTELKKLVDDYGGGRQKSNDTSKKFYDLANKVYSLNLIENLTQK